MRFLTALSSADTKETVGVSWTSYSDIFSCIFKLDVLSIIAMSLSLPDVEFEVIALDAVKRPLIAAQCRAARGLLNWSQDTLAEASKVGISTVGDFERERRTPHNHLLRDMRSALESAGIEFIAENGGGPGGPGVRLRKR
jgi:DNA-binding transcriptional regulator YiaG